MRVRLDGVGTWLSAHCQLSRALARQSIEKDLRMKWAKNRLSAQYCSAHRINHSIDRAKGSKEMERLGESAR